MQKKMYKSGKNWLIAGVTAAAISTTLCLEPENSVNADAVTQQQTVGNQKTATSEGDIQKAKIAVQQTTQDKNESQQAVNHSKANLETAKQQLTAVQQQKKQATSETITTTSTAVDNMSNTVIPRDKQTVQSDEMAVQQSQKDVNDAQNNVSAKQTQIELQQKLVNDAQNEVDHLNVKSVAEDLNQATQAVSNSKTRVAEVENNVTTIQNNISNQTNIVKEATNNVNAAKTILDHTQDLEDSSNANTKLISDKVVNDQNVVNQLNSSLELAKHNLTEAQQKLSAHEEFDRNAAVKQSDNANEGMLTDESQLPTQVIMPIPYQEKLNQHRSTAVTMYLSDGESIAYNVPLDGSGFVDRFYMVDSSKDSSPKLQFDQNGVLDSQQTQELTAYALKLINSVRNEVGLPSLNMNSLTLKAGQAMALDRAKTNTTYAHIDADKDIDDIIGQRGSGQNAGIYDQYVKVENGEMAVGDDTMLVAKANLANIIIAMLWNDAPSDWGHLKNFLNGYNPQDGYSLSTYMSLSIISPKLVNAAGGYNIAFNFYEDGSQINSSSALTISNESAGIADSLDGMLQSAVTTATTTLNKVTIDLATANKKLTADQSKLSQATVDLAKVAKNLVTAKNDYLAQQEKLTVAKNKLTQYQNELDQAQEKLDTDRATLAANQQLQKQAQDTVDNLNEIILVKQSHLSDLKNKLVELSAVLPTATQNLENQQNTLTMAQRKLATDASHLNDDLNQLTDLRNQLSVLTGVDKALTMAQKKVEQAESDYNKAVTALKTASQNQYEAQIKYKNTKLQYKQEKESLNTHPIGKKSNQLTLSLSTMPQTNKATTPYKLNIATNNIMTSAAIHKNISSDNRHNVNILPKTAVSEHILSLLLNILLGIMTIFGLSKRYQAKHLVKNDQQ